MHVPSSIIHERDGRLESGTLPVNRRLMMKALLLSVLLLVAPTLADDAKSDQEQLQGTWKVLSFELNGNKAPEDVRQKIRLIYKEDKLIVEGPDGDKKFQFSLDPDSKPKTIDVTHLEGEQKGKSAKGIYNLENGMLTVCAGEAGGNRPTEFRAGANVVLAVFERLE